MKLIAVTSPATDAGKTFIAASIAEAASSRNIKTLFIDLDNPVGDSLRVFGISSKNIYPTISSWQNFDDPWSQCLRSQRETFLLPKPDMIHEKINPVELLNKATDFELIIIDLGTDYSQEYWRTIIETSDMSLLVTDCDEKALVRVRSFLNTLSIKKNWTLAVNSREKDSYYTKSQISREFDNDVGKTLHIPYYPDAEKGSPKTLPPDNPYIVEVLSMVFPDIVVPVKPESILTINLPKMPKFQTSKLPKTSKVTIDTNKENTNKEKDKVSIFTKSGQIINGSLVKMNRVKILDKIEKCDGVVIPESWGVKYVKELHRNYPLVPIVVLGSSKEFISAGADKCVKRLTPQVIQETTALSNRINVLWSKVEIDPLTSLYTRGFLDVWIQEREAREKPYTVVIMDIDKFKQINDTYGHQAGDVVLSILGEFLNSNVRNGDIVARYGGEEFVACLPDTNDSEAFNLFERLRAMWANRTVIIADGRSISCTFSGGIAEWRYGINVIADADKKLYEAKENGRNRICVNNSPRVYVLGNCSFEHDARLQATDDPLKAVAIISDVNNVKMAPPDLPLYVISSGSVSDWTVKNLRPDATICTNLSEAIDLILKPKLSERIETIPAVSASTVPSVVGLRNDKNGFNLPYASSIYIVSPSRPAYAGEVAAAISQQIKNCALICASGESMGAKILGIPDRTLIKSDWRMLGSDAPVEWDGIMVWPVDPYKHIATREDVKKLVNNIKSHFSVVIVDCAASFDICTRANNDEGIIVLTKEGDASDQTTQHWLKTNGVINTAVVSPAEYPVLKESGDGIVLSKANTTVKRSG